MHWKALFDMGSIFAVCILNTWTKVARKTHKDCKLPSLRTGHSHFHGGLNSRYIALQLCLPGSRDGDHQAHPAGIPISYELPASTRNGRDRAWYLGRWKCWKMPAQLHIWGAKTDRFPSSSCPTRLALVQINPRRHSVGCWACRRTDCRRITESCPYPSKAESWPMVKCDVCTANPPLYTEVFSARRHQTYFT